MASKRNATYANLHRDNIKFVNRKLTADELRKFDGLNADDPEKLSVGFVSMMHAGYKLSVTFYAEGKVYNSLWLPPKEGGENEGMALSSKSPDWYRAALMGVYKHVFVCNGDWSALTEDESNEG